MMMKRLIPVVFVVFAARAAYALPDWADASRRAERYPPGSYFTGYGFAYLEQGDAKDSCLRQAESLARRNLTDSVKVGIRAEFSSVLSEKNGQLSQSVAATVESSSNLDIEGLSLDSFADEKNKTCQAFASVRCEALAKTYTLKAEALKKELEAKSVDGAAAEAAGDKTRAFVAYLDAYTLFAKLEEVQAVARVSGGGNVELPSMDKVRAAVRALSARPIDSADDMAAFLAFFLGGRKEVSKVMVAPFTFKDTRMSSQLGRYFKQAFEAKAKQLAGWDCLDKGGDYILYGTYWPQGGKVKFIASLRRVADGSLVAVAEASMPEKLLSASGLSLEPQNFARAMADRKVFQSDELAGGGLSVEAWTNKGADGVVYTKGEKMTVTVRVNMPSYVRLLYHLADGKRVLLLDNYLLDASKVNVPYTLPYEFECDAPYGAEVLQALASTDKFEPLKTASEGGYDYLAEDLKGAVMKSRGMKKKAASYKAEVRVTLTTMVK